jgi:hypothetical protein
VPASVNEKPEAAYAAFSTESELLICVEVTPPAPLLERMMCQYTGTT